MPTFCRHNRFIERCPICSKTMPEDSPLRPRASRTARPSAKRPSARAPRAAGAGARRTPRGEALRVRREIRAEDDGYRSPLVPGLHASADAQRLAEEIAFSHGRLIGLAAAPVGLYAEARDLAPSDLERATWTCFLISYLSPLDGAPDTLEEGDMLDGDAFAGIRMALARVGPDGLPDLAGVPLGPRTSHDPARGTETLLAYRHWVERSGGSAAEAFRGDASWTPERRFERVFERLALPGFARMGRYDLLVTLGRLGLYELRGGSLALSGGRGLAGEDLTTLAAKRIFAIGDPLLLERRAHALADAIDVPIEALDLALANWASTERATLGFPAGIGDEGALARSSDALGL